MAAEPTADVEVSEEVKDGRRRFDFGYGKWKTRPNKFLCWKIVYITSSILTIIMALALIVITVIVSIATRIYDVAQSSRLVGTVVLAVTAAITISMIIYSITGLLKNKSKSVHATKIVLVVLAVIQVLIISISVKLSEKDVAQIGKSLSDSFRQAKDENPKHIKLWSATQHDLKCCGVYGPGDYRTQKSVPFFSPNVPISCCLDYDPTRSEMVQEREREICKTTKKYYMDGCRWPVITAFKDTADLVFSVTIVLIVFEIISAVIGIVIDKKRDKIAERNGEDQ